MAHLNKSLHTNYLGLKNQGQWQEYIKQVRNLITKIPSSERTSAQNLTNAVNKAESLVQSLSRINQVEKSMSQNAHVIRNVRQWNLYLDLAKSDLSRVDRSEFDAEYNELVKRMKVCKDVADKLQSEYNIKLDKVVDLYTVAVNSKDPHDAWKAYDEALALPICEASTHLQYACKTLLASIGEITLTKDEIAVENACIKLAESLVQQNLTVPNIQQSTVENAIKKIVGNDINVSALNVSQDTYNREVIFDVTLGKGDAKSYLIAINFKY